MNNLKKIIPIIVMIILGGAFMIINSNKDMNSSKYVVSEVESDMDETKKNTNIDIVEVDSTKKEVSSRNNKKNITIYISGAVKSPNVVDLNSEDRLIDGVNLCGGITEEADLNKINLAMKIEDEKHYIIPKIGDEVIDTNKVNDENEINNNIESEPTSQEKEKIDTNKIDINTATLSELDSLPGFGEVTAQKIIEYRDENSKFNSIEEIKNIKGIGDKKFNNVKEYICVQ